MRKSAWVVLAIPTLAFLTTFQNCSKVEFASTDALKSTTPGEKESQFATLTAGDSANFPPLKLVFVVDNSGTMQINQINLAQAFGKMFEGDNASNLAPFDSTAIVLNTAQRSIASTDALYSKLPKLGLTELTSLPLSDVRALRGGSTSDGQLGGDLAGYAVVSSMANGLTTLSYSPMPVLGVDGSSLDVGVRKLAGGSVSEFSKAFSNRIAVLDPARSAIDPATRRGILDPIVDQESGLCAIARVLKNNSGLLNKGDLSAFVIVSDENDADPTGANCIDQVVDYRGTEALIDGRCERPTSTVSYFKAIQNPDAAKCQVAYSTGLTYDYKYKYRVTTVSYKKQRYQYDQLKTSVLYKTSSYVADVQKTKVSYYTKDPSYKVPQTKISYFTESKSCDMRDGIEINCKYSYPAASVTVDGTASANACAAFASGKLPANAVTNKSQYPITCAAAASRVVKGACSSTDSAIEDCNQNYSSLKTTELAGLHGANCDAFVANKLGAGAVYADAGKKPSCENATTRTASTVGRCPANAVNCVETFSADKTAVFNGVGTSSCSSFANSNLSGVNGAVLSNAPAGDLPRCSTAASVTVGADGVCPTTLPVDRANCKAIAGTSVVTRNYTGEPSNGQSCEAFLAAQSSQPTDRSKQGEPVVCDSKDATQTVAASLTYSNSVLPGYSPKANDACSPALISYIKTKHALSADPSSCAVTAISSAKDTLSNTTCAAQTAQSTCSSSSDKKRGCTFSDIAEGAKFETARSSTTVDEMLTCDTQCSDTNLCKDKSGTVADNFNSCVVTAAKKTTKTFTQELQSNQAKVCAQSDSLVQTKGPYYLEGKTTKYVAGDASKNAEPNALANYIKSRSAELFGSSAPSVSVFVRQKNDAMGTNGSEGTAYNAFSAMMDGQSHSVLSNADTYASSLQSLGGVIRSKLNRSMSIPGFSGDQKVLKAWHRSGNSGEWIEAAEGSDWTASGGTVTLSENFDFKFGDQFRFEFK